MLTFSPPSLAADPGSAGNLQWSFDSGAEVFDFLSYGATLTLAYTVRVTDDRGQSGDSVVKITVVGTPEASDIDLTSLSSAQGFVIQGEGQALGAGSEGQSIKVRTDNGRIVAGTLRGRTVEIRL